MPVIEIGEPRRLATYTDTASDRKDRQIEAALATVGLTWPGTDIRTFYTSAADWSIERNETAVADDVVLNALRAAAITV